MAWVVNHKATIEDSRPIGLLATVSSILLAYAFMKLYDIPFREWQRKRFLSDKKKDILLTTVK